MRKNIYITEELKKEMDKRPDINWSEIAQKAFEFTLALREDLDRLLRRS